MDERYPSPPPYPNHPPSIPHSKINSKPSNSLKFRLIPSNHINPHNTPEPAKNKPIKQPPKSAIPNQHSRNPAIHSPFKFENPLTINYPGGFAGFNSLCNQPPPLPASNARTGSGRPFDLLPLDGSQWVMRGFPEILSRATRLR